MVPLSGFVFDFACPPSIEENFQMSSESNTTTFVVFECNDCYALIPYPKAGHHCQDSLEIHWGFEVPGLMELFLIALEKARRDPTVTIKYLYAD